MDTLTLTVWAAFCVMLLLAALYLWLRAELPATPAPVRTHPPIAPQSSSFVPSHQPTPAAGAQADASSNPDDDDDGTIPRETLDAWAQITGEEPTPPRPSQAPDLYACLGVPRNATADAIRSAYRDQLKIWHPDHCDDPAAHDETAAINEAYKTLTTQRAQYDAGLALQEAIQL